MLNFEALFELVPLDLVDITILIDTWALNLYKLSRTLAIKLKLETLFRSHYFESVKALVELHEVSII